jgi:hypothetical protein
VAENKIKCEMERIDDHLTYKEMVPIIERWFIEDRGQSEVKFD